VIGFRASHPVWVCLLYKACKTCVCRREIDWKLCVGTVLDSITFESTNNGGSASAGRRTVRQKWKLPTTTKNDMKLQSTNNLLPIPHPGDVLREDFMKPLGLST
jgi:hypothetical protein